MYWNIIIGSNRDNVIKRLKKSKLARVLLVVSWVFIYQSGNWHGMSATWSFLLIGLLGLAALNLFYVPMRFLGNKHVGDGVKLTFIILVVAVTLYHFNFTSFQGFTNIFVICMSVIIISLAGSIVLAAFKKYMDVHSQEYRKSKEYQDYDKLDGWEFEQFCADVLRNNGFSNVEVTSGSGDYGIDVLACKSGLKYGIQVKRYEGNVGWHAVEEAHAGAVYYHCDRAVVLTNSYFTKQAIEGAGEIGVDLWDRKWLQGML